MLGALRQFAGVLPEALVMLALGAVRGAASSRVVVDSELSHREAARGRLL
jgi:hypothetical protein